MTRSEATALAAGRNRLPGSDRWFARAHENGEWSVVKVANPAGAPVVPLRTTTEAKPKPPQPDDPRPSDWRNVGGPWVDS